MATPAEIIAARVNGTHVEPAAPRPRLSPASESRLSSTDAFPVLGGSQKSLASTLVSLWGPQASAAAASAPASKLKVLTNQEAFLLDAEDQVHVARPELIKILTSIKAATDTSIECTTSQHTKRRTFLILGKPQDVKLAKRLVVKKLTKPVEVRFLIPAKVRSRVIGAQGRNLKPIIQATGVKVDISLGDGSALPAPADDDTDAYAKVAEVVLEGDADGCKMAKAQILAIVADELRNVAVKFPVPAQVKPFLPALVNPLAAKYPALEVMLPDRASQAQHVIVLGDYAAATALRDAVRPLVAALDAELVSDPAPVPAAQRQLLPVDQVLAEHSVYISVPEDAAEPVLFVGRPGDIAGGKAAARAAVARYRVEVLDMSKAHRGNIEHVRAVAALFNKHGTFKDIAAEHGVAINTPDLAVTADNTIPVEIVVDAADADATKNTRRAIVAAVNRVTPDQTLHVTDIDAFFQPQAAAVLDAAGVQYVVLDDNFVVFDLAAAGESEDDFDTQLTALQDADALLAPLRAAQEQLAVAVIDMPAKDQTHVMGPNGTTLNTLLAGSEPGAVQIKIHHNAEGKSPNHVLVKGYADDVARIQHSIAGLVAEAKEYAALGYTTTCEVPTFVLSRVIGKGGANITAIRDTYGVKIDIAGDAKDSENADKSLRTQILVLGIRRSADAARDALVKLAKRLADDTLVRLRVEKQYHRRMTGPSFLAITRLEERYNVKIRFPSEKLLGFGDARAHDDEITIRGPSKNVAKAEDELKQLYQYERDHGFEQTIRVPAKAIARVIGRNGESIRDVADGTGVEYRFSRDREAEEKEGYAELTLTGSKTALKEAAAKIQSIVAEVENFVSVLVAVPQAHHRDLVGPSGTTLRDIISKAGGDDLSRQQYARLVKVPAEALGSEDVKCQGPKDVVDRIVPHIEAFVADRKARVHEFYDVAKDKHRLVVGPSGSTRHALQDDFDVQINVPRPTLEATAIELYGKPEQIAQLRTRLDELTKDNWNEVVEVPAAYHLLVLDRGAFIKKLKDLGVEVAHGPAAKQAAQLSNASNPAPPAQSESESEESANLTTVAFTPADDQTVIPWRLVGEPAATAKAAELIEQQLARAKTVTHEGWYRCEDHAARFPRIVGPRGATIKKIRQSTGAVISVPRPGEKNSSVIYMMGTDAALAAAAAEFDKV